jgi:hypothetical protein
VLRFRPPELHLALTLGPPGRGKWWLWRWAQIKHVQCMKNGVGFVNGEHTCCGKNQKSLDVGLPPFQTMHIKGTVLQKLQSFVLSLVALSSLKIWAHDLMSKQFSQFSQESRLRELKFETFGALPCPSSMNLCW